MRASYVYINIMQKENWTTRRHGSAILLLLVTGMLKRTTCLQTVVNYKYMHNWAVTYGVTKWIEFQARLWQNNLSALGVCDQGRRKHYTVSTEGTEEALKWTMRKEAIYRFSATQCTHRTLLSTLNLWRLAAFWIRRTCLQHKLKTKNRISQTQPFNSIHTTL